MLQVTKIIKDNIYIAKRTTFLVKRKYSTCICGTYRPLVKSAYQKLTFLYLIQNICCGYSKFSLNETVLLMLKLMAQKNNTIFLSNMFFILTYVYLMGKLFIKLFSILGYVIHVYILTKS